MMLKSVNIRRIHYGSDQSLCPFTYRRSCRAIAGTYRDHGRAEIQAIGAGAVNQAIKAVVIAKGYLAEEGKAIVLVPSMVDVDIDGEDRTAIRLSIGPARNAA